MDTTTPKCHRCHRVLRSESSIARGYGAGCARKIRETAKVIDAKPTQVAKAMEIIELGAIVPVHKGRAFRVVSSKGDQTYLTAPEACTCAAGLRGRYDCAHRLAARLLNRKTTTTHQPIAA